MYSLFLSKRRVPFQGIGTWEYYLGERCRRQLGFRCQVPNDPPQMMHGPKDRPEDVRAVTLVKVGLDYASWFANNSIGNILNVTRSLGGPEIAGKVIDQWLVGSYISDLFIMYLLCSIIITWSYYFVFLGQAPTEPDPC